MVTEQDVRTVAGRFEQWAEALRGLSEPGACRDLLDALDQGDGPRLHEIMRGWGFRPPVTCVEVAETLTRLVHTGDMVAKEVCTLVPRLRPPDPSPFHGRGYALSNGTILWLSEKEFWDLVDRAHDDEAWREANHALLRDLDIISCTFELQPSIQRVDVTKTYTLCTPGWDPKSG